MSYSTSYSLNPQELTPDEVQASLATGNTPQLVDVRQPWEYAQHHIPGVRLIPLGELAARYAEDLTPDAETICLCEHGVRSDTAARFLAAHGFGRVATMTGGMAQYNGPVETGFPEERTV